MTKTKVVFRGVVRLVEYTVNVNPYDGSCSIDWSFDDAELDCEDVTITEEEYIHGCIWDNEQMLSLWA